MDYEVEPLYVHAPQLAVRQGLRLITTDGHRGLHAALALTYPRVPRQTCWVHVLRNVANRLRLRDRATCLQMARRIYQARNPHAASRALHQWRQAWQRTAPTAVACLLRDWEALLAFYAVPASDWRRVRTTDENVKDDSFRPWSETTNVIPV